MEVLSDEETKKCPLWPRPYTIKLKKMNISQEIYDDLYYNYSIKLIGADLPIREINVQDAMQFADLLAKCTYSPTAKKESAVGAGNCDIARTCLS